MKQENRTRRCWTTRNRTRRNRTTRNRKTSAGREEEKGRAVTVREELDEKKKHKKKQGARRNKGQEDQVGKKQHEKKL